MDKNYEVSIQRKSIYTPFKQGYLHYRVVVASSGFEAYIDTGYSGEALKDPATDWARITIYFPQMYRLEETRLSAYGFMLEGKIPIIPGTPPIAGILLSRIFYLGVSVESYSAIA